MAAGHFRICILCMGELITMLLKLIGHPLGSIFPTTLDALLKMLCHRVKYKEKFYDVCPNYSCNQLYAETEIPPRRKCMPHMVYNAVMNLHWIPLRSGLVQEEIKWVPHKTFYFVPPSVWIQKFLSDSAFCKLVNKPVATETTVANEWNGMRDTFDGNIWKGIFKKNKPS